MPEKDEKKYEKGNLYHIKVSDLKTDENQPRKHFDEAAQKELVESIKNHGVLQPIIFRQEEGQLLVVAGERRFKAATEVGLDTVPAILVEGKPAEIALVENLLRQDLTAIEFAEALDRTKTEHNYTQVELASIIGKSETTVSEILSLMKLPDEIRDECRKDPSISRQTLLDISKKKTVKGMLTSFKKYKEKLSKEKADKKPKRKKTWQNKFYSACEGLKAIIKDQDYESLDDPTKNGLIVSIEELITEAKSFIEKMKAAQFEPAEKGKKPEAESLIKENEETAPRKKVKKKKLVKLADLHSITKVK